MDSTLTKGHGGVFEVRVNGAVVAAKSWQGFPDDRQIVDAVKHALG